MDAYERAAELVPGLFVGQPLAAAAEVLLAEVERLRAERDRYREALIDRAHGGVDNAL